jgi:hypothetical protein
LLVDACEPPQVCRRLFGFESGRYGRLLGHGVVALLGFAGGMLPMGSKSRRLLNHSTHSGVAAVRRALESAGVEFIEENGGGPGVRLRQRHQRKP